MLPDNDLRSRLDAQDAYLKHATGGADEALKLLTGKSDAESVHRAIDILLEQQKAQEAADWVRDLAPDDAWVDRAIVAFVLNNETDQADRLLKWCDERLDQLVETRARVAYAQALDWRTFSGNRKVRIPGELTEDQRIAALRILELLKPILFLVKGRGRIDSALQANAVQLGHHMHWLLQEYEDAKEYGKFLETYEPLPLAVARIHLQSPGGDSRGVAQRLREAHPDSFEAQLLAVLLEADVDGKAADAFQACKTLVPMALLRQRGEDIAEALTDVAQEVGICALKEVAIIISTFLSSSHRLRRLLDVRILLEEGKLQQVKDLIGDLIDESDPVWLQLHASFLMASGQKQEAAERLERVAAIIPHPDLLRRSATVSASVGRVRTAIGAARRIVAQQPQSIDAHLLLAQLLVKASEFELAAQEFQQLERLEPDKLAHSLNYAASLMQAGLLNEALQKYDNLCEVAPPPLAAVLGRAHLLRLMGRAEKAVASLQHFQSQFWDDWHFVAAMLDLGYAGKREDLAHEALVQLNLLKGKGEAPSDIVRPFSLDELKEQMVQWRSVEKDLRQQILVGKAPWLFVDRLLRVPAYAAWCWRTQQLRWLGDDTDSRAQFAIYASNGFYCIKRGEESATLTSVECPHDLDRLVIDLTSLISLHRLNLLDVALQSVRRIVIPNQYFVEELEERDKLRNHQPSRRDEAQNIVMAIDGGILTVGDESEMRQRGIPYVHEHTMEDNPSSGPYRLADLVTVLAESGQLDDHHLQKLRDVSQKSAATDTGARKIQLGEKVLIEASTLRTLAHFQALSPTLSVVRVSISQTDADELRRELRSYDEADKIEKGHKELWEAVRNHSAIEPLVVELPIDWQELEDRDKGTLSAVLLASQERLPLLVDDRVLQNHYLTKRPDFPSAFGTAQFVEWLAAKGKIPKDDAVAALLRMIHWRFRFIVLSGEHLKRLADRHHSTLPGADLVAVANYVHDCMSDPGLFGGLEPTEPPVSMAIRLFQSWSSSIAEFVMTLWADMGYEKEEATALTLWAARELLPSPPKVMGLNSVAAAMVSRRAVIARAMIAACSIENSERASEGLRMLAAGLGLTEREYLRISTEVIDAV
ncbi:MAG TPA: hypothetical protein VF669_01665 [Tepidisphaeraceae bacterium]